MSPQTYPSAREQPGFSRHERQSALRPAFLLAITGLLLPVFLVSCRASRPSDPIEVVHAAYDRLNAGDIDGYMEFLSDDAVLLDGTGRTEGVEAIRADLELSVGPGRHRFEISDLNLDGNVVYYTYDVYEDDRFVASNMGAAVVVDGRIIFDGSASMLSIECYRDPSQAFCPGG